MSGFQRVAQLLLDGIRDRAFPGAAIEVGRADAPIWRHVAGTLTYDPGARPVDARTIFDLASLTKVIATTTLAMRACDDGRLALDEPVSGRLSGWRGADRSRVTIRQLLDHSSGLTAYLPFYRDHTGRAEFEPAICALPLEYAPGTASVYSDLGFILLGFVLEDVAPSAAPAPGAIDPGVRLGAQFRRIATYLTPEPLAFNPPRPWRARCAPTEVDPWRGRLLIGEVHDENAWALGGAAGHAGLFGTATAVGAFARAVLTTLAGERLLARPETMRQFITPSGVPGSSRALGWDTMRPTSSCGTRMSPTAIGHTGFTGTSLWIDWERDLYVALLTNRVHPTRDNDRLRLLRPRIHDAVLEAVLA
jgi:CubicO group peptidase (beta-lactamase class C family)